MQALTRAILRGCLDEDQSGARHQGQQQRGTSARTTRDTLQTRAPKNIYKHDVYSENQIQNQIQNPTARRRNIWGVHMSGHPDLAGCTRIHAGGRKCGGGEALSK